MHKRERHCCEYLQSQIDLVCERHPEPGDCGDYVIGYLPKFDEFGIWIHDGPAGSASSWSTIQFCPYCGTKLPNDRRGEWFDRLEVMGLEPEDAPAEMMAYGWWRS